MPTIGRGGAGNIEEATRQAAGHAKSDLEASQTTYTPASVQQSYAHMGRGGAGNYYSPATLEQNGTFLTPPVQTSQQTQAMYRGRGGAGNFVGSPVQESTSPEDNPAFKADIEAQVLAALPRPPEQVYLAGKDREASDEDVENNRIHLPEVEGTKRTPGQDWQLGQ